MEKRVVIWFSDGQCEVSWEKFGADERWVAVKVEYLPSEVSEWLERLLFKRGDDIYDG